MKEQEHAIKNKPKSKPEANPDANDNLKSLPLPELQMKLGSSPDGLTEAEAQKRLTQYGPNEIEEKKYRHLLCPGHTSSMPYSGHSGIQGYKK
mgnify:CR=1 FL=1